MTGTTCARGCMSQRKLRRSDARPLRAPPADGNVTAQPAQRRARVGGSTARDGDVRRLRATQVGYGTECGRPPEPCARADGA